MRSIGSYAAALGYMLELGLNIGPLVEVVQGKLFLALADHWIDISADLLKLGVVLVWPNEEGLSVLCGVLNGLASLEMRAPVKAAHEVAGLE